MIEETLMQPDKQEKDIPEQIYDLIIIGSGPAGMSAAICAGRAKLSTIIIDKALPGGQASTAYMIENYLGFPGGIYGPELALRMEDHVKEFDIEYVCASVDDISSVNARIKRVKTDIGTEYRAHFIILATGLEPKPLESSFEQSFMGRGLSYYAQSDVESYRDKDVAVIGGGNCAMYAADYLAQFVRRLYVIHKSDRIKAVSSLRERVLNNSKITVVWNTRLTDIFGIDNVEKIKCENIFTGQSNWLDVKGVFVYIGRIPPKVIVALGLQLDEDGYVITDEYMRTSIPGIYAAGDVRSKQIRQIATAVSDGMIAAINVGKEMTE